MASGLENARGGWGLKVVELPKDRGAANQDAKAPFKCDCLGRRVVSTSPEAVASVTVVYISYISLVVVRVCGEGDTRRMRA